MTELVQTAGPSQPVITLISSLSDLQLSDLVHVRSRLHVDLVLQLLVTLLQLSELLPQL